MAEKGEQSVADFYVGKSVFITGVTGFIGKVFMEKLLRSCTGIDKVYVLIRNKKNETVLQRTQKLLDKPLFSEIKRERPQDLQKVVPIAGDICEPDLGITAEDKEVLLEKVSVVFHVAACVKFNEPLLIAVNTNLEGTRRTLDLSKQMRNIQAFVYVSTAFTNTDKNVIEEIVYPPPAKFSDVEKYLICNARVGIADDEKEITKLLNGRPNTYTFTKALAETLIAEHYRDLPCTIIRPSVVSVAEKEPLEGWIDAWSGPGLILATIGKGMNRVIYGDEKNILDYIPVDYVTNLSIIAATKCESSSSVSVYNSCSSSCNPVTYKECWQYFCDYGTANGFNDLPYPEYGLFTKRKWLMFIITQLLQVLPAYVMDFWQLLRLKKPRYVKMMHKFLEIRNVLNYFTSNSWVWRTDRARALYYSLSTEDQRIFPCDPAAIDWKKYLALTCYGFNTYLLNK